MKSVITLICLTIFLVNIYAQTTTKSTDAPTNTPASSGTITTVRKDVSTLGPACIGSVAQPTCFGRWNEGLEIGPDCSLRSNKNMWYYSQRYGSCRTLDYKGCEGNNNRFCTKTECEQRCGH